MVPRKVCPHSSVCKQTPLTDIQKLRDFSTSCTHIYLCCIPLTRRRQNNIWPRYFTPSPRRHLSKPWSNTGCPSRIASLLIICSCNYVSRLSNLFNATPRQSALRLPVYNTLLRIATSNHELEVLGLSRADVEKWLKEWKVSSEEKSAFLKTIVDAYAKADQLWVLTILLGSWRRNSTFFPYVW